MKIWFFLVFLTLGSSCAIATPTAVLDINEPMPQGETRIWSPLFQASWDEMKSHHSGKLQKVIPPNPLIKKLENFSWKKDQVMPPNGYAIFSGPDTPEFTKKVAKEMRDRFDVEFAGFGKNHNPSATAYYGVLSRDLVFKKQFYESKKFPLTFNDSSGKTHKVRFFGTAKRNSDGYGKNVRILHNDPAKNTFVLSIKTHTKGEDIIIFQPTKSLSFAHGIAKVTQALTNPCNGKFAEPTYPYLIEGDIIKIPYVTIDVRTSLAKQLSGKRYYEGDPRPWTVNRAYQVTQFRLTEKGARIRLQTGMDDAFGGQPEPRKFICDRPFFIFAWRDGAKLPYFAAWIDGKEVMQKFQ